MQEHRDTEAFFDSTFNAIDTIWKRFVETVLCMSKNGGHPYGLKNVGSERSTFHCFIYFHMGEKLGTKNRVYIINIYIYINIHVVYNI